MLRPKISTQQVSQGFLFSFLYVEFQESSYTFILLIHCYLMKNQQLLDKEQRHSNS